MSVVPVLQDLGKCGQSVELRVTHKANTFAPTPRIASFAYTLEQQKSKFDIYSCSWRYKLVLHWQFILALTQETDFLRYYQTNEQQAEEEE